MKALEKVRTDLVTGAKAKDSGVGFGQFLSQVFRKIPMVHGPGKIDQDWTTEHPTESSVSNSI